MVYDLIVNLYQNDFKVSGNNNIVKILSPDYDLLIDFIAKNFPGGWEAEVKASLYKPDASCFIAVENKEIIGFACYDATAKGYFGPTGVKESKRGNKIGSDLLLKTLSAMRDNGYGYAIIGAVDNKVIPFYEKTVGAIAISNSDKHSIYSRLVRRSN